MIEEKIRKNLSKENITSRTFTNIVSQFQLDTKAVLDVGCSEGLHLSHFGEGSMGVTIIPEHVEQANARGLEVVEGNIEDPDFSLSEKFDVVWANNLFEHMNSPHLFLMKMREFLKPEGMLILGVPMLPAFKFLKRFNTFRGAYAVSHVNFFTRETLAETVRAGGWTVREARAFYFQNKIIDARANVIAPHIYVIAHPTPDFDYPNKRRRSLQGYGK